MRRATFRQSAPAVKRTRVVRVQAMQQKPTAFVAAAAAAVLMLSGPATAATSVAFNPVSDLAKDPVTKLLNKLDSYDPPKGVPGPEVEGQFRANPEKARALALENSPAGSPEAEAKAARTK